MCSWQFKACLVLTLVLLGGQTKLSLKASCLAQSRDKTAVVHVMHVHGITKSATYCDGTAHSKA